MKKIGFIGGGNMAEALIKGIIGAEVFSAGDVLVSDVSSERVHYLAGRYGVQAVSSNVELLGKADIVVLSVKPQVIDDVLGEIAGKLRDGAVVISIAAGVTAAKISGALAGATVIRVMPNTPALIGQGASGIYSANASEAQMDMAVKLFGAVGIAVVVEEEGLIDAVTAVSGSGPAYYFAMMEEMIRTAEELGLSSDIASQLVLQTAVGAGLLAKDAAEMGEQPAQLRQKVTSPGGTTEAALKVFAQKDFGALITAALTAARDKSRELSG